MIAGNRGAPILLSDFRDGMIGPDIDMISRAFPLQPRNQRRISMAQTQNTITAYLLRALHVCDERADTDPGRIGSIEPAHIFQRTRSDVFVAALAGHLFQKL